MLFQNNQFIKKFLRKNLREFVLSSQLPTVSQPTSRFRSNLALAILIVAGYAGNYFYLPLFFGVDFLFGSIAALIVLYLYGRVWGTIAAMIAGVHTFFLWGHPYAAIILTLEAFLVGYWRRHRRQNLLLLDGFYWIVIGMPLIGLFYGAVMGVQTQSVLLVMLKQSVNGIFNALIANLLLAHSPVPNWIARPKVIKTVSLQQTLFNLLVVCVFVPALTLMVLHGRNVLSNIEATIQTNLQRESSDVIVKSQLWHERSLNALQQLADMTARFDMTPSLALQQSTELLQRTVPNFARVVVVNAKGQAIAAYPPIDNTIADSTDWQTFNQENITSDIAITDDTTPSPKLIQRVPIIQNNRFLGTVISQSDLSFANQFLKSLIYDGELEITLLDRQERVIATTRSELPILQTLTQQSGEIHPLKDNIYQWLPKAERTPIMVRWKNSFYVQRTPSDQTLPWTVLVEAPTKPHFSYLQNLYIESLASTLLIAVLALILARIISGWLAQPIWNLAVVTTDVPDRLLGQTAIAWPSSWVTEFDTLVDNFKFMASTLEQKFQEINSAKEQLEQRVQERTRELVTANRELEIEVAERQRVAEALQQSEALLRAQTQKLEKALHKLRHAQAQVVQTEKMSSLGQLVAGVAHEINNPINFIYGNLIHAQSYTEDLLELVQVYQQHYSPPAASIQAVIEAIDLEFLQDDLPKLMNSMQVGAQRIHQIVQSLRNFSRLDEAEMKEVDIHEGINSTLMILQNRLKCPSLRSLGKGRNYLNIEVFKEYGNLPLVECYPGELNQVFINILTNAIDALEEYFSQTKEDDNSSFICSPWIRIRTDVIENNWITISITNNGQTITEALASKLFDPFFTTKPVGKGTGLGLSISYQIVVKRHGGKLYCNSELEQGAEFVIEIPMRQPLH